MPVTYGYRTSTDEQTRVTYEYIRVTNKYIQVTYEYIGATYDDTRVMNMERIIFHFTFHVYMNARHVLHTHESAASATHRRARDTYMRVRDPPTKKPSLIDREPGTD